MLGFRIGCVETSGYTATELISEMELTVNFEKKVNAMYL